MSIASSKHWSDYWNNGHLTSLPQDYHGNYDGNIKSFWLETLKILTNGCQVLDLCTGNGAIAVITTEESSRKGLDIQITGVDAAKINKDVIISSHPDMEQYINLIKFVDNTLIENLPFQGETFDLITSQFGFEYCNWERGAKEISRVLTKNGQLVLVCHSPDSHIIEFMEKEEFEYGIIHRTDLYPLFVKFLNDNISYFKFRKNLRKIKRIISGRTKHKQTPIIDNFLNLISFILASNEDDILARKQDISEFLQQMKFAYLRVKDLLRVNLALSKDENIATVFANYNFECLRSGVLETEQLNRAGKYYIFRKNC